MSRRPVAGRSANPVRKAKPTAKPLAKASARPPGRAARGATTRRPVIALRARLAAWPWPRITAATVLVAVVVSMGWLTLGPALRVSAVEISGNEWTAESALNRALAPITGAALLTVDPNAVARDVLAIPGVTGATVSVRIPGTVLVQISEAGPAVLWRTSAVTLLLNPDGVVIGELARTAAIPESLANLPFVEDRRVTSRNLIRGDRLDAAELATALRLAAVTPAELGSGAGSLSIAVDERYGFELLSQGSRWTAVFGFSGMNPTDNEAIMAARLTSQTDAIRTLFVSQPEETLLWIDVRDPGRVYFRAGG